MLRLRRGFSLFILLGILVPLGFAANASSSAPEPQFRRRNNTGIPPPPDINDKQHVKARNEERQKELKADTEKLLELATELKQFVDKTNSSVLSVDVIHKAEEIEKLAKKVKEKMKGE